MMDRRDFLRLLGLGTAAAAVPAALLLEPRRKLWQVPSNAPVGSRVERIGSTDVTFGSQEPWLILGDEPEWSPAWQAAMRRFAAEPALDNHAAFVPKEPLTERSFNFPVREWDDDPEPLNFLRVPQGWEELLAPHRATNLEVCKRGLSAAEIHELANISAEFHREKLELQRGLITRHIQAHINTMVSGSVDAPTATFSTAWDRGTQNRATGDEADS